MGGKRRVLTPCTADACSAVLERERLTAIRWDGLTAALFVVFALALFLLYSLVPLMLRWSSATIFNLSLLTSDVYSLLFGLFLFHYTVGGPCEVGATARIGRRTHIPPRPRR